MNISKMMRPIAAVATCAWLLGLLAMTSSANANTPLGLLAIAPASVRLEHEPGNIVARGTTDEDGNIEFRDLAPGHYTLVIDGKSLAKAMAPPEPKKGGSSFSIGFGGGMLGGGGGHSGSDHPGAVGGGSGHGGSGGGGGVGASVTIPLGGGGDSGKPVTHPAVLIALLLPAVQSARESAHRISVAVPIPTDASNDLYFGFDVQAGGTVRVQLSTGTKEEGTPDKNETWISGVGDDANPCSRTAPCDFPSTVKPRPEVRQALSSTTDMGGSPTPHDATRTWISGVGDDANPCSRTAPCKSFVGVRVSVVDGSGRDAGRATTDDRGGVSFRDLKSGRYTLVIDGKSLAAADGIIFGIGGHGYADRSASSGGRQAATDDASIRITMRLARAGGSAQPAEYAHYLQPVPFDPYDGASKARDTRIDFTIPKGTGAAPQETFIVFFDFDKAN